MEKEKRVLFDKKRFELEKQRRELQLKIEKEELEAKLAESKRRASAAAKKATYDAKYVYVAGGHAKNELLGFLTVFNFNRSLKVKIKRFVQYDPDDKRLYLDIYESRKRDPAVKAKVFVYIHGGGWIGGLPETREAFTTRVADAGYFVVSLFYGYAPFYAHPQPIENIYKAFAWLKEHAEEYNIDTDAIFVGGESAGGHLSAMAGAISSNPDYAAQFKLDELGKTQKIKALVLNCGVYDMEKAVTTGFKNIDFYVQSYCGGVKIADTAEDYRREISPINWVTPAFPPTYAVSAENDKLAILTFDLVAKLLDLGVPVTHYHGEGKFAVHAFAVAQCLRISKQVMSGALRFLKDNE